MSKRSIQLGGVLVVVATSAFALFDSAQAHSELKIYEPTTTGAFDVAEHNRKQIARLGFEVRQSLSALEGSALEQELKRLQLTTTGGAQLHAFAVDKGRGLVIGTTAQSTTLSINATTATDRGTDLVISARSEDGSFQALGPGQIGVFSFEGSHVGFEMEQFSQAEQRRAYFAILLDRSGSMKSVIKSVQEAATEFMQTLPANARCRVISFNTSLKQHSQDFEQCAPKHHRLTRLTAKGGTNLQRPLLAAYAALNNVPDELKAVLVITDGVGDLNRRTVQAAKTAPTHVLFMGEHETQHLEGIADTFIYGSQDLQAVMGRYFKALSEAVAHQYVIHLPAQPKPRNSSKSK